ncbi:MAG: rod shape-determining protein MreD [Magnetococcales bacterium]|nr:rod shape-determining protein MreD [Magnetococcales bacterium]MBF0155763.1 rod shape-determining protein MreD [Magnetococcales bacterium]
MSGLAVVLSLIVPWLPAASVFLVLVIQSLALPSVGWSVFRPDLVLIVLFYWRLFRPDLCGVMLAFASGLALDIVSGLPWGLNALTKSLMILLVGHQGNRLRAADFNVLPLILLFLALVEEGGKWFLMLLLQGWHWPGIRLAGGPLATMLISPLLVRVLIRLHKNWVERR